MVEEVFISEKIKRSPFSKAATELRRRFGIDKKRFKRRMTRPNREIFLQIYPFRFSK